MDTSTHKLSDAIGHERFHFFEGDITIDKEWIEYHIKKCDVVIPLVAIANPLQYGQDPIGVFELDFEANLQIVKQCVRHKKRLIFPSTSEVYGMSSDGVLDEFESDLVYGPIHKQRWIYATSKQLLDRVIFAYGIRDSLDYTLFRPFNWIGPNLDDIFSEKEGSSRLFTQFISNILRERPLQLVDGGRQRRSFTYIDDGITALLRIIENLSGCATRQIFNIGNPDNDVSVLNLARTIISVCAEHSVLRRYAERASMEVVSAEQYFGRYYQDIQKRVPSIRNARDRLGWLPKVPLRDAIKRTLDHYVLECGGKIGLGHEAPASEPRTTC